MARQQLMTGWQIRDLLAGLPAWQGTGVSCTDGYPFSAGKVNLKNWDRGFGEPLGAFRVDQLRLFKHDSVAPWSGRSVRHAPLAVNPLTPRIQPSSETLPSGHSGADSLLMTGKARYVLRSCLALAVHANNRTRTTQSD